MIIKNYNQLATNSLRKQALLVAEAGLESINTTRITEDQFAYEESSDTIYINGEKFPLKGFKRVVVVGLGKVAAEAAAVLERKLDKRLSAGIIIDIVPVHLKKIQSFVGTHPLPSSANEDATKQIVQLLNESGEHDFIIAIISGGGSSLLCAPAEVTLDEERAITQGLMHAGASINEINTVRKHMSSVKGGGLAKAAFPATVVSLIFSDVPGDDISQVASGPTVFDTTTSNDAIAVLGKYDILARCKMDSCGFVETPKEERYFKRVNNILFCSAQVALTAMQNKAHDFGWKTKIWNKSFGGEAKDIGKKIVGEVAAGQCLIGAGESVVTIPPGNKGKGSGGRNQEMALAAAQVIGEETVFVTIASDGRDNSDVAGAIVDASTKGAIQKLGVSLEEALEAHDEYALLLDAGASVMTGITGSNVSDFFVCIKQ